jgi:hypothetical protein
MQVQVELKFVRQEMKKLHRAKLRPMRARRQLLRCTSSSPIMNSLDRQIYSDMIFPLIAAADGARARLLPRVCKGWRQCFMLTKSNWHLFAVTQAIKDFDKLARFLHGAYRLKELQLVCQEGAVVESPHSLRTLLSALTMLQSLSLIAPGRALCGTQEARHPLRAHDAPLRPPRVAATSALCPLVHTRRLVLVWVRVWGGCDDVMPFTRCSSRFQASTWRVFEQQAFRLTGCYRE